MYPNSNQMGYCVQMFHIFVLKSELASTYRTFHNKWYRFTTFPFL